MTDDAPDPVSYPANGTTGDARPKKALIVDVERARRGPVFLERDTYRKRRLIDAARLLPVFGALFWGLPVLWGPGGATTSMAMLFIFGVWLVLVIGAFILARRLRGVTDIRGEQSQITPNHGASGYEKDPTRDQN